MNAVYFDKSGRQRKKPLLNMRGGMTETRHVGSAITFLILLFLEARGQVLGSSISTSGKQRFRIIRLMGSSA